MWRKGLCSVWRATTSPNRWLRWLLLWECPRSAHLVPRMGTGTNLLINLQLYWNKTPERFGEEAAQCRWFLPPTGGCLPGGDVQEHMMMLGDKDIMDLYWQKKLLIVQINFKYSILSSIEWMWAEDFNSSAIDCRVVESYLALIKINTVLIFQNPVQSGAINF